MAVQSAIQLPKGQALQPAGHPAARKDGGEGQGEGARDQAFEALLSALAGAGAALLPQQAAKPVSPPAGQPGLSRAIVLPQGGDAAAAGVQAIVPRSPAAAPALQPVPAAAAASGLASSGAAPLPVPEAGAGQIRGEAAALSRRAEVSQAGGGEGAAAEEVRPAGGGKATSPANGPVQGTQEGGAIKVGTADGVPKPAAEPAELRAPAPPAAEPGAGSARAAEAAAPKSAAPAAAQAALQVASMMRTGKDSLRFELTPADLGRVTIRLKIKEGQTRLVIAVEKPAALEALRIGSPNLQSALQSAGLDIESQDLRFELQNGRQDLAGQERGEGQARREGGHAAKEGEHGASRLARTADRGPGADNDDALFL